MGWDEAKVSQRHSGGEGAAMAAFESHRTAVLSSSPGVSLFYAAVCSRLCGDGRGASYVDGEFL